MKFSQRLAKIVGKYYRVVKVVLYFKTGRKLLSFFSKKVKNYFQDISVGVYFHAKTDLPYIGETKKSLKIRMKQPDSN